MNRTPIELNFAELPDALHPYLRGAALFDSSCSPQFRVLFIEKDGGYFLKIGDRAALEHECALTRYFHGKSLAANVPLFEADAATGYLLTERLPGEDFAMAPYIDDPKRLCDTFAERLSLLHGLDFADCPVQNHTARYLGRVEENYSAGVFDSGLTGESRTAEEAHRAAAEGHRLLRTDTLLHGDYCLPNLLFEDWRFSGFIDLDGAGVGDRHVDLFWGAWSLCYNLKTDRYRQRFFDAYGRDRIDEEALRCVTACEAFG